MNIQELHFTLLAFGGLCLSLSAGFAVSPKRDCDCPGPINYYKELGCKPIYKNPGDCCPVRYNCSDWTNLPENKCLINGHRYNDGEKLRDEDRNPDEDCRCSGKYGWSCLEASCDWSFYVNHNPKLTCYLTRNLFNRCGRTICVEEKDRATCLVDGKIYIDGEFFEPSAEPDARCICSGDYKGENVEPYCVKSNHTWCNNVIRNVFHIRNNCFPTYAEKSSLTTACNTGYRCQRDGDYITNPKHETPQDPDMTCKFGNMTMAIGEQLNLVTKLASDAGGSWNDECTKCTCQVPPIATCKRLKFC